MAAPSPTARGVPTGIKMKDGYRALITLSNNTTIQLWEKQVQPPGFDGGDAIEQTTMHNDDYRTFAPRSLITLTEFSVTAAYDPGVLTAISQQVNREQTITITFTDGSTWACFGFMKSFTPQQMSEGEQPEAEITIQPTNWDPTNRVEAGPALASVTGT